jgi:hyperosmotically inducible periplasmic protein
MIRKFNPAIVIMGAVAMLGSIGTVPASQTSDRVESSAQKSYVFMTYLKGDDIKIQAMNDSSFTLTGTVAEWWHRSLAEETVAGLPGVARVDNKLEVKDGQPVEKSDSWICAKVKAVLMFHRNVSGLKTDVDVKEGVVTLRGQASSEAQKELTAEYAKDVEGVKTVKNDMTVLKTEKSTLEKVGTEIDDASITAQVKLALLLHRSTSILKTKVETSHGIVTVRGIAKNNAEKDLVGKLVIDVNGVKTLRNEITIGKASMK